MAGGFVFLPLDEPQDRSRNRARRRILHLLEREAVERAPHVLQVEVPVDLGGSEWRITRRTTASGTRGRRVPAGR
jgi:hypothetical protein